MSSRAHARPARWGILMVAALTAARADLARAQAAPPDSAVYRIVPSSRFEVRTGKAGLFGFAGHTHVVRARAFTGWVTYRPEDPSASHLELTVLAESLEVLTPRPARWRLCGSTRTLVGQTRSVPVEVRIEPGSDTLRFAVKQSDFGIKPFSGGPGGTVKVADRVTFDFEALAVREPAP